MSPDIIIVSDKGRVMKRIKNVSDTHLFSIGMDILRAKRGEKVHTDDPEDVEFYNEKDRIALAFQEAGTEIPKTKKKKTT